MRCIERFSPTELGNHRLLQLLPYTRRTKKERGACSLHIATEKLKAFIKIYRRASAQRGELNYLPFSQMGKRQVGKIAGLSLNTQKLASPSNRNDVAIVSLNNALGSPCCARGKDQRDHIVVLGDK